MGLFHTRLGEALDASRIYRGNRAKLSRALGMSPNYISTILSTGANPNWDVAVRIARELRVSLSYLGGLSDHPYDMSDMATTSPLSGPAMDFFDQISSSLRQAAILRGEEPTIDDFMLLWYKYGHHLTGFGPALDWADLYLAPAPGDAGLMVHAVGPKSLAARTLGRSDTGALQYALDHVQDAELRARLFRAYLEAARGNPILSQEHLDVQAPGHAERIRLDYTRLLLPVIGEGGQAMVLSFSKPLR
jgi:transcriptional regulator with XRE-family HTH domain